MTIMTLLVVLASQAYGFLEARVASITLSNVVLTHDDEGPLDDWSFTLKHKAWQGEPGTRGKVIVHRYMDPKNGGEQPQWVTIAEAETTGGPEWQFDHLPLGIHDNEKYVLIVHFFVPGRLVPWAWIGSSNIITLHHIDMSQIPPPPVPEMLDRIGA